MRKYKKQELFNCIKTLLDAHKKLDKVNMQTRINILPQCQEMAIQVGTEIERSEGEGTFAVSYLEQYCEELYLASNGCKEKEWVQHQKRIKTLLLQTEKSIRDDISDSPLEIVFLPYKASMWDALDSVYRAAVQEQNCNVIVMPIPYYNISSQGEVLSVEYEGALFPEDIETTDFRECDLGKLHPDVIFIHNPYDEYNRVTQVPQEYFSSSLVNYTEHLVYIPYFVTRGDTIKQDYCIMPGVKNAWRTFVQSEAVRACYIEAGADVGKVVALGSPKFDMVVRMQENPPEIPKEWQEALSGRKIFLLNTHLNPIINDAEKMIDKLHQIFALFAERDDVALLWRPHPLSIQTVKSMNPRMLEAYLDVVETFKKLGNGIYDDSADVHRAIAISDAYIGNWSSLVTMYGITGKPIYILSLEGEHNIRIPEQMKYLQFACGVKWRNELWVAGENYNGLYKIDMNTKKVEFVTSFEKEGIHAKELYHQMILYEDDIYFIPWRATYIAVYHIKSGETDYVELGIPSEYGVPKFSSAVRYENYIYMFPARAKAIVRLDVSNGKVECFAECCQDIEHYGTQLATFGTGCVCGDKFYVSTVNTNCIVKFNLKDSTYQKHMLMGSLSSTLDVAFGEKYLYVLNISGEVVQIERETFREKLLWKYDGEASTMPFAKIAYYNDDIWLLPHKENKIVKISIRKQIEVNEIVFPDTYIIWNTLHSRTVEYILQNNKIIIFPRSANMMLTYDIDEHSWCMDCFPIDEENLTNYKVHYKCSLIRKKIYMEKWDSVECFVNLINFEADICDETRRESFTQNQKNANGTCGIKIWEYVLKETT